jgi:hypothetical protein
MSIKIATADYRALAALRYRIRLFLREGDAALDTLLGRMPEPRRVNSAPYDQTKGRGNNRAQG